MEEQVKYVVKIDNQSFFDSIKELLFSGKLVKLRVAGNSMSPFLQEGDEVVVRGVGAQAIKIGDVVLARWMQGYVLHRVVQFRGKRILLAGDHNLVQIEVIKTEQLMAVLIGVYRRQGASYVHSARNRWAGMAWYYLRPFRRVWTKIYSTLIQ